MVEKVDTPPPDDEIIKILDDYTGDPKHCHQCALAAWAKEWKRADHWMAEAQRLLTLAGPDGRRAPDWQPIETAPEGEPVLVWVPNWPRIEIATRGTTARGNAGKWFRQADGGDLLATHWMPLPPVPMPPNSAYGQPGQAQIKNRTQERDYEERRASEAEAKLEALVALIATWRKRAPTHVVDAERVFLSCADELAEAIGQLPREEKP